MPSDEPRSESPQLVETHAAVHQGPAASCTPPFLAALAHQLRNTVFGLTATIDLLEISIPQAPPFAQAATSMRLHTARLLRILAELDAYGRADIAPAGTLPLASLLQSASSAVVSLAEERGVSLHAPSGESATRAVRADASNLERAVRSLLELAILRSPARGTVTLSVNTSLDERLELRVEDQGHPLGPALLAQALEPFAVRNGELTGLSLALAARIARAHGGGLVVEDLPAGGLVTRLVLPALPDAAGDDVPSLPPATDDSPSSR